MTVEWARKSEASHERYVRCRCRGVRPRRISSPRSVCDQRLELVQQRNDVASLEDALELSLSAHVLG